MLLLCVRFSVVKEAEANKLKLTPQYLELKFIEAIADNTKIFFGEKVWSLSFSPYVHVLCVNTHPVCIWTLLASLPCRCLIWCWISGCLGIFCNKCLGTFQERCPMGRTQKLIKFWSGTLISITVNIFTATLLQKEVTKQGKGKYWSGFSFGKSPRNLFWLTSRLGFRIYT